MAAVPEEKEESRWELLSIENSPLLELPETEGAEYLLDYLFEVGPMNTLGMGPSPITYTDIKHWSEITNTHISPLDAHLLRHLSREYVSQFNASKENNAPAPALEDQKTIEEQRSTVVSKFKAFAQSKNSANKKRKRGL